MGTPPNTPHKGTKGERGQRQHQVGDRRSPGDGAGDKGGGGGLHSPRPVTSQLAAGSRRGPSPAGGQRKMAAQPRCAVGPLPAQGARDGPPRPETPHPHPAAQCPPECGDAGRAGGPPPAAAQGGRGRGALTVSGADRPDWSPEEEEKEEEKEERGKLLGGGGGGSLCGAGSGAVGSWRGGGLKRQPRCLMGRLRAGLVASGLRVFPPTREAGAGMCAAASRALEGLPAMRRQPARTLPLWCRSAHPPGSGQPSCAMQP
jgi:hypothetical protein